MSARFTPACAIALPCMVSSSESQSFRAQSSQNATRNSCRLSVVDSEARCGSYEVYEDRRAEGTPYLAKNRRAARALLFIRNDKGQVEQMLSIQDGRVTKSKKIK
jgi:hypothetical protein